MNRKKIKPTFREDGTYRVRWTQRGMRRSMAFRVKAEALKLCRQINRGEYPSLESSSRKSESTHSRSSIKYFSDLTKKYFEHHVEVNCTPSTKRNYEMYLRIHIVPFFGKIALDELDLEHLDAFAARLKTKKRFHKKKDRTRLTSKKNCKGVEVNLSEKMQRELISAVLSITKYGYDRNYLDPYPFKSFKLKKLKAKRTDYFNGDEVEKFLSWCEAGGPYSNPDILGSDGKPVISFTRNIKRDTEIFNFALNTGARAGEILGLKRKAIDFKNRIIWISEIYDLSARELAERTKGGNVRCIEFNETVEEILRKREGFGPEDLVFSGLEYPLWLDSFYLYCNRAGVKQISFHGLRHTFATAMALHTPTPVLQNILGHQHIVTTMKYVHIAQSASIGYTGKLGSIYKSHRSEEELAALTLTVVA